ncbi:helix-turn-helix domain-containing protein [Deinococcus wulumuqiensis]|uniref:XRE family transcriptional regulator n=1 Tax=Deinococcus wulumuqiensis TaxID=980427 RepID=A0A345IL91_9DEIO|nr:helix-turn-helix transcriptional regulator [Deinococcus wulumuqiensis]AXH00464.1 XRE family transcriptional regulator [Deinococcus wulumuqiensis]QII22273.1 helix-turn-helix transcriptional regulator [Deinococcus wulumuqiensis R12]GGI86165.1 hypothetical protein GCM10010914_20690 [Deinococcus wulumuqiensis]GGI93342.1 hypothetical protein GCM10010914_29900 [Deinococcus wulumuqiensis]GGP30972.1 hypothetical protein GCM10008021_26230 [Deinococcus wulumuqiensis]
MPTEPRPVSPSRLLFANRVRQERKARGWTQEDLGERCDLSWNYIGQVERGTRNISVDNMDAIAQAFNLHLADLLLPGASVRAETEIAEEKAPPHE